MSEFRDKGKFRIAYRRAMPLKHLSICVVLDIRTNIEEVQAESIA
jgi:hypothetical protein